MELPVGFVAYPSSPPSIGETIKTAAEGINRAKVCHLKAWEELQIGGRVLIDTICAEIDKAQYFVADVSGMNPNVLYELGFAIARGKRTWLLLDDSVDEYKHLWNTFRLLSTSGYRASVNSDMIERLYWQDVPHDSLNQSILMESMQASLGSASDERLLYVKPRTATNATNAISRRLSKSSLRITSDDPAEVPNQTLIWYAQQTWGSRGVLCQFEDPRRDGARERNAKMAFVAGMAHGFDKDVLLLSEGEQLAPLDYRDRMKNYQTASAASGHLEPWLLRLESESAEASGERDRARAVRRARLAMVTELQGLQLGEHIAENEEEALRDSYFVNTAPYTQALSGQAPSLLFIGAKGAGKSANCALLYSTFAADRRNIVSLAKPGYYELNALVRVLGSFGKRDRKAYLVEGMWRYLFYAEICDSLYRSLEERHRSTLTSGEADFVDFWQTRFGPVASESLDFTSRLEELIERLESHVDLDSERLSSEEFSQEATKLLHGELLAEIRKVLAPALPDQGAVVLLVDNLDKSWERQSGLAELSEFLWGALRAATRLANELRKLVSKGRLETRVIVFLRTDIYERLRPLARESDKLPASWLLWNDHELLFRVIEQRLVSSQSDDSEPEEIWDRFFASPVGQESAKEFFLSQSLPKPRDLLYLVKEAVFQAINHGNGRVSAVDAEAAALRYSEFAYDVLRIEDASSENGVADALIELTGGPSQLTWGTLVNALKKGGVDFSSGDAELEAVRRLVLFGFLQPQVSENEYRTVERLSELDKALALARRYSESVGGDTRFQVHRAFRPFLELSEAN